MHGLYCQPQSLLACIAERFQSVRAMMAPFYSAQAQNLYSPAYFYSFAAKRTSLDTDRIEESHEGCLAR